MAAKTEHATAAPVMISQPDMREREVNKERKIINIDKAHIHAAILTKDKPGERKILNRGLLGRIRERILGGHAPEVEEVTSGSIYERTERWKNVDYDIAMNRWKTLINEQFLAQFKNRERDKDILRKIGISTENGADGLYNEYFAKDKGAGDLGYFARKVVDALSSDEIAANIGLLRALGGVFGKESAEVSRYLVEATNNMMVTDEPTYKAYEDKAAEEFGKTMAVPDFRVLNGIEVRSGRLMQEMETQEGRSVRSPQQDTGAQSGADRAQQAEAERLMAEGRRIQAETKKMDAGQMDNALSQLKDQIREKQVFKDLGSFLDSVKESKSKLTEEEFKIVAGETLLILRFALLHPNEGDQLLGAMEVYNRIYYIHSSFGDNDKKAVYSEFLKKFEEGLEKQNIKKLGVYVGGPIDPNIMKVFLDEAGDAVPGQVYRVILPGFRMGDQIIQQAAVTRGATKEELEAERQAREQPVSTQPEAEIDDRVKADIATRVEKAKQAAMTNEEFMDLSHSKNLKDEDVERMNACLVQLKSLPEFDYAMIQYGITDEDSRREKVAVQRANFKKLIDQKAVPKIILRMIKGDGKVEEGFGTYIDIERFEEGVPEDKKIEIANQVIDMHKSPA